MDRIFNRNLGSYGSFTFTHITMYKYLEVLGAVNFRGSSGGSSIRAGTMGSSGSGSSSIRALDHSLLQFEYHVTAYNIRCMSSTQLVSRSLICLCVCGRSAFQFHFIAPSPPFHFQSICLTGLRGQMQMAPQCPLAVPNCPFIDRIAKHNLSPSHSYGNLFCLETDLTLGFRICYSTYRSTHVLR